MAMASARPQLRNPGPGPSWAHCGPALLHVRACCASGRSGSASRSRAVHSLRHITAAAARPRTLHLRVQGPRTAVTAAAAAAPGAEAGGSGEGEAGAQQQAAGSLGPVQRLVCVAAMTIPLLEGMLRLTSLLLVYLHQWLLELGVWIWVKGESAAAAIRGGPHDWVLRRDVASCQQSLDLIHDAQLHLQRTRSSLDPLLLPATLPFPSLDTASAAATAASSFLPPSLPFPSLPASCPAPGLNPSAPGFGIFSPDSAAVLSQLGPFLASATLAWLLLTLSHVTVHQCARERDVVEAREGGKGPPARGEQTRRRLGGGVDTGSDTVAAFCLSALMLRLSWSPGVPLSSGSLTTLVYRPAVLLLTLTATSLALAAIIKVVVLPPRSASAWSGAAALLVTCTQAVSRLQVHAVQLDLLLLAALGPGAGASPVAPGLSLELMVGLVLAYALYCIVLVWLQALMGQLRCMNSVKQGKR